MFRENQNTAAETHIVVHEKTHKCQEDSSLFSGKNTVAEGKFRHCSQKEKRYYGDSILLFTKKVALLKYRKGKRCCKWATVYCDFAS